MDETTIRVDNETRDLIILRHLPLVRSIARVVSLSLPSSVDVENLVGHGIVGLVAAAMRYDPRKDGRFETYATDVVRGAILDSLRSLDTLSQYYRRRAKVVSRAAAGLASELGRAPTDEELAADLGLSIDGYHELARKIEPAVHVPLDSFLPFGDASLILSVPVNHDSDPGLAAERRELRTLLLEAIGRLTKGEARVIRLRYSEETSVPNIAGLLGVVGARVRPVHCTAVLGMT
jgi:RNA polymerase sigma factor for flagellar operon FliA